MNKDGFPFVFLNEEWIPYCGKYFLNNKNAMTEFCQKMNHTTGRLMDQKNTRAIGRCYNGDKLQKTGIQIAFKCQGGNLDRTISCKGKNVHPSHNVIIYLPKFSCLRVFYFSILQEPNVDRKGLHFHVQSVPNSVGMVLVLKTA